ncbi:hypothetical protein D3C71_1387060 [compost metagenome]
MACRVTRVASSRSSSSSVPIQPNWRAQLALSRYSPMLVGEVRCATISYGAVWRLSGGRWWLGASTQRSNKRQVSRATPCSRSWSCADSVGLPRPDGTRLASHTSSGDSAHSASSGPTKAQGAWVPPAHSATPQPSASKGAALCLRSVAPRPVIRVFCAASAVVHSSRCQRLTACRCTVRTTASPSSSACCGSRAKCHTPLARALNRSPDASCTKRMPTSPKRLGTQPASAPIKGAAA